MDDELRCTLALHRIPGVGPILYKEFMAHFGSAQETLAAAPTLDTEGRITAKILAHLQAPDWAAVDADITWAESTGNLIIHIRDPRYPYRLAQIGDPPPILFIRGDVSVLDRPQIAIVGTRNPSPTGRDTARFFARELATAGLVVTSGLAYGIDAIGHEGALEAENGRTVAVVATGLDRVYPSENLALAHRIAERGALVTEYPPGTPTMGANFLRRNRIISGLSLGTLVVEASTRSGSLVTARAASEQGREVFSIPGSIYNPLSRGCHVLIREGAKLVENANDILNEIALAKAATSVRPPATPTPPLDGDYKKVMDCFGYDPLSIDALIEQSGLTPAVVSSMLLVLELRGLLAAQPGGLYTRTT